MPMDIALRQQEGRYTRYLFVINRLFQLVAAETKDSYSRTLAVYGNQGGFPIRPDCAAQQLVKGS